MDAKEFFMTARKICQSNDECESCEYNGYCITVAFAGYTDAEYERLVYQAIKITEDVLGHRKTFADDFFEKFQNALKEDGVPRSCREDVYGTRGICRSSCVTCWNEPFTEEKTK